MIRRLGLSGSLSRAVILGAVVIASVGLSIVYDLFWLPKVELTVRSLSDRHVQSQGNEIWFQLWRDSVTQVSPSHMRRDAGWSVNQGWLVAQGGGVSLTYVGPYSKGMMVRFHSHPWSGRVALGINGSIATLDLYSDVNGNLELPLELPLADWQSWITGALVVWVSGTFLLAAFLSWGTITHCAMYQLPRTFIGTLLTGLFAVHAYPIDAGYTLTAAGTVALSGLVILIAVRYLAHLNGTRMSASTVSVHAPLLAFFVCAAALWCVFWPAIMSLDSINVLDQVRRAAFSDWHPAAYVLLVGATQWVYKSPASMVLLHMLGLALVYVWGVRLLYRHGGGSLAAYLSWGLLILSPVSMVMLVTLWKDVPYGIALLALSIACAAIYVSRGEWLEHVRNLVVLSMAVVAVSLFRHNGVPAAFLTIVAVMLLYQRYWHCLALVLLVSAAAIAIIRGPVYDMFGVSKVGASHALFAHHIAAHLAAGTQLYGDDKALLESIRPVDGGWGYQCGSVNPTIFYGGYNSERASAERARLAKLAIKLAISEPLTELRHVVCAGSLVWRVTNDQRFLPYIFAAWLENGSSRYIYNNDLGYSEARWASDLRDALVKKLSELPTGVYRPAGWLYLLVFFTAIFIMRSRDWRVGIIVAPVLIHSVFMLLFNVAQDVRYQYPVFLTFSLLGPWLLFASPVHPRVDTTGRGVCE